MFLKVCKIPTTENCLTYVSPLVELVLYFGEVARSCKEVQRNVKKSVRERSRRMRSVGEHTGDIDAYRKISIL